jgi:ADP-ribose pyrophosphatase YjhB (NUDIX family)
MLAYFMTADKYLLKKYPGIKIAHENYELDQDNFINLKLKLETSKSEGGAIGLIWTESGEIILTKRTVLHPGWALLGGTVEENENFDDTFIREAKEEAGVEVEIIRLVKLECNTYRSPDGQKLTMHLAIFEAKVKKGSEVKETEGAKAEGLTVKVFNKNNLPENMILKDREKIIDILKAN